MCYIGYTDKSTSLRAFQSKFKKLISRLLVMLMIHFLYLTFPYEMYDIRGDFRETLLPFS